MSFYLQYAKLAYSTGTIYFCYNISNQLFEFVLCKVSSIPNIIISFHVSSMLTCMFLNLAIVFSHLLYNKSFVWMLWIVKTSKKVSWLSTFVCLGQYVCNFVGRLFCNISVWLNDQNEKTHDYSISILGFLSLM